MFFNYSNLDFGCLEYNSPELHETAMTDFVFATVLFVADAWDKGLCLGPQLTNH